MSASAGRVGSAPVVRTLPSVSLAEAAEAASADVRGDGATRLLDATHDSREVSPGALFFCVRGAHDDGHAFAAEAVSAGAVALVVEHWLELEVPQALVPSVRQAMGPMSAAVFGRPAEAMTMVGVTGTNGKTTTTYLLEAVFRATGLTPAVIGTTGARIDGTPVALARTTPEAPDLQRLLARMRDEGVRAVATEVSSHALAQDRVGGVTFDAALFTNLTQDHLDFHPSMEDYFEAKGSLFSPRHARRACVNVDDDWGRLLLERTTIPIQTFGVQTAADLRADRVRVDADGIAFRASGVEVRSGLRGAFNVWNCLGALSVANALGIDFGTAARALSGVRGVPGRMEPVDGGQGFLVMVDYAHTPDSILSVLRASRPLASGRVIVVFGCGGDRDRAKRPAMGLAATTNADLTIVTSDNPRSEDPGAIMADIEPGARQGGGDYRFEPDRRTAIRLALGTATAGDVVVIAGKGHEAYQELGDQTVSFDDRLVALEELRELRGAL